METYVITRKDLDSRNVYIGKTNLCNFNGNITIENNRGPVVQFPRGLAATGNIDFPDSGIYSHDGVRAGGSIRVGKRLTALGIIEAGGGIEAYSIDAGYRLSANGVISVRHNIKAGEYILGGDDVLTERGIISAHSGIAAKGHIEGDEAIFASTGSINAGGNIVTRQGGITAGGSIRCKTLSAATRILAGVSPYEVPCAEDMQICCVRLEKGIVAHGTLIESAPAAPAREQTLAYAFAEIAQLRARLERLDPSATPVWPAPCPTPVPGTPQTP